MTDLFGKNAGNVNAQDSWNFGRQNPNAVIDPSSLEGQLAILGQKQAQGYNGVNVASGMGYTDEWGSRT